jgi:hypothetical protein
MSHPDPTGRLAMTIEVPPELEVPLRAEAARAGLEPQALVLGFLRERLLPSLHPIEPRDEWERRLLGMGRDCGVSLDDEAVSRAGIYE